MIKCAYTELALWQIRRLKLYTQKPFKWTNDNISILGVTITVGLDDLFQLNYNKIIDKAEAIVNLWQHRSLTLTGKVLVVNTLVSSLFTYKMMVLNSLSQQFITKIQTIINKFLWGNKKTKIKRDILKLPKMLGGLRLALRLDSIFIK